MKKLSLVLLVLILASVPLSSIFAQGGTDVDEPYKQVVLSDGSFTFAIPESWIVDAELFGKDSIVIGSSEAILEKEAGDSFEAGEISILINIIEQESLEDLGLTGETSEDKLIAFEESLMAAYNAEGEEPSFVSEGVVLVEGFDETFQGAQLTYSLSDNIHATFIFWDISEDYFGFAAIRFADGEWEEFEPTVHNILQSVRDASDFEWIEIEETDEGEDE